MLAERYEVDHPRGGQPGQIGATYRYLSKAMGQTFDSTLRLVRVDAPREVAFEGGWTDMIRPSGR